MGCEAVTTPLVAGTGDRREIEWSSEASCIAQVSTHSRAHRQQLRWVDMDLPLIIDCHLDLVMNALTLKRDLLLDLGQLSGHRANAAGGAQDGSEVAAGTSYWNSPCRALVPGDRQFCDEQIRVLIERGGILRTAATPGCSTAAENWG